MRILGLRRGDTLIETMFAVAIFSIIAMAVIATMNSSLSNAQGTLESTMARNEIDAQAEALRYIHSSYIAEREGEQGVYYDIWKEIKGRANEPSDDVVKYNPTTCADLYDRNKAGNIYGQKAFILNTRDLNNVGAVVEASVGGGVFSQATLYPRTLYRNEDGVSLLDGNLIYRDLEEAQGIYIVAVKDMEGTTTVDESGVTRGAAYFDFYIRTCWDRAGSTRTADTSTVIRLYDPDVEVVNYDSTEFVLAFDANGGNANSVPDTLTYSARAKEHTFTIPNQRPTRSGYGEFMGWSPVRGENNCGDRAVIEGEDFTVTYESPNQTLYAIWECDFSIRYSASEPTSFLPGTQTERVRGSRTWQPILRGEVPVAVSGNNFWKWEYDGNDYSPNRLGPVLTAPRNTTATLNAKFISDFAIYYNNNGDGIVPRSTTCTPNTSNANATTQCVISPDKPTRTGYKFVGWAESAGGSVRYQPGGTVELSVLNTSKTLYAKWTQQNDKITIKLRFSYGDCDSHVEGQKSSGDTFHAFYGAPEGVDDDGSSRMIAELEDGIYGDKRDGGTETFTLNTTGGKTYYYYMHNFSGCDGGASPRVTVTSQNGDFEEKTYYFSQASGGWSSKWYWNVFAYKDGRIVDRMTKTSSPEVFY